MIFYIDLGLLFVIVLILATGSIATIASWIMNHIILFIVLLTIKTLLIFGRCLFAKRQTSSYYIGVGIIVFLDIIRNGAFLFYAIRLCSNMLSEGFFNFILGGINLIIGCLVGVVVTEGPMYLVYDDIDESSGIIQSIVMSIVLEIISIAALGIAYLFFI